jgi:hypothetical protein
VITHAERLKQKASQLNVVRQRLREVRLPVASPFQEANLDAVQKKKNSCPYQESNLDSSVIQAVT